VADALVGLDGDALVLVTRGSAVHPTPPNLGSSPVARWNLSAAPPGGERRVLASGAEARRWFETALDEWRLLTAAALAGLARRSVEIAAAYATERIQFDRPIAAFQGIAHPLANAVTDAEGARLLVWYAVWSIAKGRPDAAALIPYSLGWAARAATYAVARALHTHGGYGLSLEYDIQLYHRRGKAWALLGGDPRDLFVEGAERRWGKAAVSLPESGDPQIDFSMGEKGEATRLVARRFFEENITPEIRATFHFSWDGHNAELASKLADAGLLYPTCAPEHGGRSATPYEAAAIMEEYSHAGVTTHAVGTTHIVAETVRKFGSPELQAEVMPKFARGGANCALGYTEPGSGSDVAAAQTRAARDGDHWVINGQKMFTSGAHIAQYVFLLTRTDSDAKKHRGLTMFLLPIDTPGIEIQPIYTLSDERTNATYYTNVRVPDRYRVGPVNGGWSVLHHALDIEHGGGGFGGGGHEHRKLADLAAEWAHQTGRWSDPRVRERIGFVGARSMVNRVLGLYGLWSGAERRPDCGEGPMYSLFSAEAWIEDAADMMDLCAPDSILATGAPGAVGGGEIELAYRHSTALSIYGGSSEIMRSIIAQLTLRMPRSRS
jgi:alkylation response protein AidB-like acyl-CoA dehydrogenase